jgi:putative ABC transport system permease protein
MNLLILVARQLSERKLRSGLTVGGIAIGISALVSLILLSGALQSSVTGQLESFGTDEILLAPLDSVGGASGPQGVSSLTDADLRVVASVAQVDRVIPVLAKAVRVESGRDETFLTVRGAPPDEIEDFIGRELSEGRYIREGDRAVVMIGSRIADGAFTREVVLGSRLRVNGSAFRVIGIFLESGSLQEDLVVVMPIDDLRDAIGERDAVTAARAIVTPGADLKVVEERIQRALERYRGDDDIGTTTPSEIIDQIGGFLGVVNVVVYSIAAVSLLVAGVGIMNSLFTSVLQRTNEIGTMKAVGATNGQILFVFLAESALLGFIGGVVGSLLGVLAALGFGTVFNSLGVFRLEIAIPSMLIIASLAFSLVLGILAGTLPAIRASRLDPVDALRYE